VPEDCSCEGQVPYRYAQETPWPPAAVFSGQGEGTEKGSVLAVLCIEVS